VDPGWDVSSAVEYVPLAVRIGSVFPSFQVQPSAFFRISKFVSRSMETELCLQVPSVSMMSPGEHCDRRVICGGSDGQGYCIIDNKHPEWTFIISYHLLLFGEVPMDKAEKGVGMPYCSLTMYRKNQLIIALTL
jgi:hypothetical protein